MIVKVSQVEERLINLDPKQRPRFGVIVQNETKK